MVFTLVHRPLTNGGWRWEKHLLDVAFGHRFHKDKLKSQHTDGRRSWLKPGGFSVVFRFPAHRPVERRLWPTGSPACQRESWHADGRWTGGEWVSLWVFPLTVKIPDFKIFTTRISIMAKNTGDDHRIGSVIDRTQTQAPNGNWVKRDTNTGQFIDQKTTDKEPFKGVAKEPDKRRDK